MLRISCIYLITLMMKMIYIAMISRTDEPMEGVVFDVQDHARQTGTRGPVHMGR
jgi:hypothetical protein